MPSKVLRSHGIAIHSALYLSDSSFAFSIRGGAFLAEIYTLAPLARKPAVIISPIPLDPPVTTTTFPVTLNKLLISIILSLCVCLTAYYILHFYKTTT